MGTINLSCRCSLVVYRPKSFSLALRVCVHPSQLRTIICCPHFYLISSKILARLLVCRLDRCSLFTLIFGAVVCERFDYFIISHRLFIVSAIASHCAAPRISGSVFSTP